MNVLYIGDVMGETGMRVVERVLPKLRIDKQIAVVIAQSENVSDGKGMTVSDYQRLKKTGVDIFTGGNHTPNREELAALLLDPSSPVMGPANMPECPGQGYKLVKVGDYSILTISLLGQIVGKDAENPVVNPLVKVDEILAALKDQPRDATVVNFHGDYSSEKVVIGNYLDGQASLVVGDHWHIPTADARVLPGGTAHMTDVGMCGTLNSSLGVEYDSIIARWKQGRPTKNVLATAAPYQFNALLVEVGPNGLAQSVQSIRQILD